MPSDPRVRKTYDEYGPGNPLSAFTKNPESSEITVQLFDWAACLAAKEAISVKSFD